MGNCIGSACALLSSNKKVSPDGDDQELKASSKKSSGPCSSPETVLDSGLCRGQLPLSASLKLGEVQLDIDNMSCKRMKIVVNKKQLQLLMTRLEELKSRHVSVRLIGGKRGKKWKPSLATIPEV